MFISTIRTDRFLSHILHWVFFSSFIFKLKKHEITRNLHFDFQNHLHSIRLSKGVNWIRILHRYFVHDFFFDRNWIFIGLPNHSVFFTFIFVRQFFEQFISNKWQHRFFPNLSKSNFRNKMWTNTLQLLTVAIDVKMPTKTFIENYLWIYGVNNK